MDTDGTRMRIAYFCFISLVFFSCNTSKEYDGMEKTNYPSVPESWNGMYYKTEGLSMNGDQWWIKEGTIYGYRDYQDPPAWHPFLGANATEMNDFCMECDWQMSEVESVVFDGGVRILTFQRKSLLSG